MRAAFILCLGIAGFAAGVGVSYETMPKAPPLLPVQIEYKPSETKPLTDGYILTGRLGAVDIKNNSFTFISADPYSDSITDQYLISYASSTKILNMSTTTLDFSTEALATIADKRLKVRFDRGEDGSLIATFIMAPAAINNAQYYAKK